MPTPVKPAKHADLSDVSTPHVLADLEAAVCSEGEADSKIATHRGDASAHHTKTTSFADITDRAGATKLNWGTGKLLKGAGASADPIEIIAPDQDLRTTDNVAFAQLAVGDIVFANGWRFTEIENGIALINNKGNIVRRWTNE